MILQLSLSTRTVRGRAAGRRGRTKLHPNAKSRCKQPRTTTTPNGARMQGRVVYGGAVGAQWRGFIRSGSSMLGARPISPAASLQHGSSRVLSCPWAWSGGGLGKHWSATLLNVSAHSKPRASAEASTHSLRHFGVGGRWSLVLPAGFV